MTHPFIEKQQQAAANYGKWVKYQNKWFNPMEWIHYERSSYDPIDKSKLTYKFANELLHEAREAILAKCAMGEDVTKLLVRYFEFDKRVIKWLEDTALRNTAMPF